MRVKVVSKFKDKNSGVIYEKDDVLELSSERYSEILKVGKFIKPFKGIVAESKVIKVEDSPEDKEVLEEEVLEDDIPAEWGNLEGLAEEDVK